MEYKKITNLLGSTSDKVLRFVTKKRTKVLTKKWKKVHDLEKHTILTSK